MPLILMDKILFMLALSSLTFVEGKSYTGSYIVSADSQLTFADAESFCKTNYGSNLATITTESDNTAVQQACTNAGVDSETVWIGLTDLASEGSWSWTDSTTVTYVNWKIAEPLGGVLENCVVMNLAENTYQGQWSDVSCSDLSYFVCNTIATSSPTQAPSTSSISLSSTRPTFSSSSIQLTMNTSSIASTSTAANDNDVSADAECKCDDDENYSELSTVVVITIAWALIVLSCSFVHIVICIKERTRTGVDNVQTLHPVHSLHPVESDRNIQKSATLTETHHQHVMHFDGHIHVDTARKSDLMKYNVRHESKILPVAATAYDRNSHDTYVSKDYPSSNTVFVNELARVQFARTSKISEDSLETAAMGAEDDEDDAGEYPGKATGNMPQKRMHTSSKQKITE